MKIRIRDVLSLSGRDYVVEGLVSYQLAGKTVSFARAVDGAEVLWIESPPDGGSARSGTSGTATPPTSGTVVPDRLLVLHEIHDLDLSVPPPESISYHGVVYVQRLAGRAMLEVSGAVPERPNGTTRLWRYRSAGDRYLQIEEQDGRVLMWAGEAMHRGMIDVLPGR
jgi:uncharacterized protein DUF4178